MPSTDRIIIGEGIPGDMTEETVELLLHNLREQLLDRLARAGYAVDPSEVKGVVRGPYKAATRRVEVWVPYEPHTPEHRAALTAAYEDGLASARAWWATVTDEHVPTGEDGARLTGHEWAEYIKALAECPYEADDPQPGTVAAVLVTAWRRGWVEESTARTEGRVPHASPYKRVVRP